MSRQWYFPATELGPAFDLDPDRIGWAHTGLEVLRLAPGESVDRDTGGFEVAVLPLSGSAHVRMALDHGWAECDLAGRESVFTGVSDWAYVPPGRTVTLTAVDGPLHVALPRARADDGYPELCYEPATNVPVEVRGAGPATRQVNNFMAPGVFDGPERLMCVELLTPGGNWSSYPPHRHDDSPECPVNNEEIYFFMIGSEAAHASPGFAVHRTYTPDGDVDVTLDIADGDVFCVHRGYHGPCIAAPGYPLYYLNVLAGPGGERSMAFCDDPAHHWVRDTWEGMPVDPRCPMTSAHGPVSR